MRLSLVAALFVLGITAAAAVGQPSAAARASSYMMISSIKFAAKNTPSPGMDSACIARLPDTALLDEHQALFDGHFTDAEIAQLDAFFASELGEKYVRDGLQQAESSRFGVAHAAVAFTPQESAELEVVTSSGAWTKYRQIVLESGQEWRATVGEALGKLLAGCTRSTP